MASFKLTKENEEFLTSLFTMLNKCIEFDTREFSHLVNYTKKQLEIDTIPSIQDISSVIANPSVINAFNKNILDIETTYFDIEQNYKLVLKFENEEATLTQPDKEFLISLFTMLNDEPLRFERLIKYIKKELSIVDIPSAQVIPSVISNPSIIKAFNTNKQYIKRFIKREENSITLSPSIRYEPFNTFNFGSVRQENTFNQRFNKESPTSILLNINLHGEFVEQIIKKHINGILINKFSVAATGQCSFSSLDEERYIAYALCDAVASGGIIDVPTILKEATSHSKIQTNMDAEPHTYFKTLESTLDHSFRRNNSLPYSNTSHHSGKVGEENTFGNLYFEKKYTLDTTRPFGIYLCKNWDVINGFAMDNLLTNRMFIEFMNNKYEPEHRWVENFYPLKYGVKTKGQETYLSNTDVYPQLCKFSPDYELGLRACIKTIVSSDLFEFCQLYGRPDISLIDNSCSVFYGTYFGENLNEEQIKMRYRIYDYMHHPENANVAKGTRKGKKRKSRKCKGSRKGKEKSKGSKKILRNR
jgi:hypothetical protein